MHNLILETQAHILKSSPPARLGFDETEIRATRVSSKRTRIPELLQTIEHLELEMKKVREENEQLERDIHATTSRAKRAETRERALKSVQNYEQSHAHKQLEEMQAEMTGMSETRIETQRNYDKILKQRDQAREDLARAENQHLLECEGFKLDTTTLTAEKERLESMKGDLTQNLEETKGMLAKSLKQVSKFVTDMDVLHSNFLKLEQVNKTYETNMELLRKDITRLRSQLSEFELMEGKRKETISFLIKQLESHGVKKSDISNDLPYGVGALGFGSETGPLSNQFGSLAVSSNSFELDLRKIEKEVEEDGGLRESELRAFDSNMLDELDLINNDEGWPFLEKYPPLN